MPDSEGQPPLLITILVIAVGSLVWQILSVYKRREQNDLLFRPAFWLGSAAWITLGVLVRSESN